jgi:hypothetical protein
MNRIFGTSSSSKKPKATLQDVVDQVGIAYLERHWGTFRVFMINRYPARHDRQMPDRPLSRSRSRSSTESSCGTRSR